MPKVKPKRIISVYKGKIEVKDLIFKIISLTARR
ncbi:hypothetical protein CTER_4543 [Ruminiclostridium cellobioparum subsp. termitidis CT1112]|uniref:Uncharacterized protein n=1 Tax=Ruminiclostridium cellobioparum subsp. termitidis CT1112 TaxID=1195236 RepID=S0FFS0_RUMCE|nr:hypothetical protein CTER_4543 [Ruminiclostridium cellobioparum subsp. termitidis CT1112]